MSLTTGTYLDRILLNTYEEVATRKRERSLTDVREAALSTRAPIPIVPALRGTTVSVIAEIKRASPSKGTIAANINAPEVAREYIAGGAAALSVLTDTRFFQGSLDDLRAVREVAHAGSVPTPILRKDFVIDEYQIAEARAAGADAVLLIVAALEYSALSELHTCAHDYGLSALVEVHDAHELDRAVSLGAAVIGINSRDLRSFQVDLGTIERLAVLVPADTTLVGESGIRSREDVQRLGAAGVHAVLVGETLMRAPDRAAAVRGLRI